MYKTIRNTLLTALCALATVNSSAQTLDVRIAYVGERDTQAWMGSAQGRDEANHQGEFLGQKYTLDAATEDAVAILADTDSESLKNLSKANPDKIIFNLTNRDDNLRSACFADNVFHVIPSDAILRDAEAQWQQKNPDSKAIAQTWHHSFVKYAARQLNKRFTKTQGAPMEDAGWAGWAAVKMLSDTVARTQSDSAPVLLKFMQTELNFDGQKGITMTYRDTGQLRQPVLLVENDEIVGEAPVRGVVNTSDLDSLGLTSCPG